VGALSAFITIIFFGGPRRPGEKSNAAEQIRQTGLQAFGDLPNVHERHVPNPALDPAVVRPVHPAALRSLFLIDLLLLTDAANGAAKSDADVERHWLTSSGRAADAYTADGSHCEH